MPTKIILCAVKIDKDGCVEDYISCPTKKELDKINNDKQ